VPVFQFRPDFILAVAVQVLVAGLYTWASGNTAPMPPTFLPATSTLPFCISVELALVAALATEPVKAQVPEACANAATCRTTRLKSIRAKLGIFVFTVPFSFC
jgi:hypothetical protein